MRVSDMFPSKYLKADDLKDSSGHPRSFVLTIDRVCQEEIKGENGDELKWAIYFQGAEKGLILNQTNAYSIAQLYGEDVGNWGGKAIELYPATTTYKGQVRACIRVRMASGQTVASQSYAQRRDPPPQPINDPAQQGPVTAPAMADDEIPF